MEGWMTCYIRNECKRSAPRQIPARRRWCEKVKNKISDFEAISGNFKRFQADFNAQLGVSSLH
jgi:hypothetical protein